MSLAYYNENDPYAAQWLRNLIDDGQLPYGDVDERDIRLVRGADLRLYSHCHFFAGVGGWAVGLGLAGWPAGKEVWTGSCPCQPFSAAGKRKGFADERHLWPEWLRLIRERRPATVLGEQVANGSGPWLDLVCSDLEDADYAVGTAVLPAAGVGAPHIRNRVWFVAQSNRQRQHGLPVDAEVATVSEPVANPDAPGPPLRHEPQLLAQCTPVERGGWWAAEPGMGRVVDGFPTRAQRLRAYGNAIVPQATAAFVVAAMDAIG